MSEELSQLKAEEADLKSQIAALEKKKSIVGSKIAKIVTAQMQAQYPYPENLTWDYIFSVPHYIHRIDEDRRKKFEAFTGKEKYYFPINLDHCNGNTSAFIVGIYLNHRYQPANIEYAIDCLKPIMEAALRSGQEIFELTGRDNYLSLRKFEDKWYILGQWQANMNEKPSHPHWSGDSWEQGLRFYNGTREKKMGEDD